MVNHLALVMKGIPEWADEQGKTLEQSYMLSFIILHEVIKKCIEKNIPILTIYLASERFIRKQNDFETMVESLAGFFSTIAKEQFIHEHQVKITVLGKWYSLPGRLIDPIKEALDETKEYDQFFLNLCINYDGQTEIVDAAKLVARQVQSGKLDPEGITKEILKENLASSFFPPPEIIIKTGRLHETSGMLLWDSSHAHIYFAKRYWPEFSLADIEKAVDEQKRLLRRR